MTTQALFSGISSLKLKHIRASFDAGQNVYWAHMHSSPSQQLKPCCSSEIIDDGIAYQKFLGRSAFSRRSSQADGLARTYFVLASDAGVYNLGGDLALFIEAIRHKNKEALLKYALKCVEAVHGFQDIADGQVHSIALVQGDALGGGLEVALSCNTLIAERGASMGFPEVHFGLFPGMGAYSLLRRKVSPALAKKMITDGQMYSAEALYDLGIVDVLAEKGYGVEAVNDLVKKEQRFGSVFNRVDRIHRRHTAAPLEELNQITTEWVEEAMGLGEKSVRVIERVIKAQTRHFAKSAPLTHVS